MNGNSEKKIPNWLLLNYKIQFVLQFISMEQDGTEIGRIVNQIMHDIPFGTQMQDIPTVNRSLANHLVADWIQSEVVPLEIFNQNDISQVLKYLRKPLGGEMPDIEPLNAEEMGLEMKYIRGGRFRMGTNNCHSEHPEFPEHDVFIDDFFISDAPVTDSLYKFANEERQKDYQQLPITDVNWYMAIEFCNKLSKKTGLQQCYTIDRLQVSCDFEKNGYRLPTEAEWEYAARSGGRSNRKWSGTNYIHDESGERYYFRGTPNVLNDYAWTTSNSNNRIHPVKSLHPNDLGLYGMSGNVSEWCYDVMAPFSRDLIENPRGPKEGDKRVLKGGAFNSIPEYCTNDLRLSRPPEHRFNFIGFRLAQSISTNSHSR